MNSNKINVRRSFIFTPGLKPEMFPKAIASGADMVCIELEDGIAIKDKDEARKNTIDALKNLEVKNWEDENNGNKDNIDINTIKENLEKLL